jgi:hypothetical protein
VFDQGGKLLSALASIIDTQDQDEIERVADTLPDLLGICYLFGLPSSMLRRVRKDGALSPAGAADKLERAQGDQPVVTQRVP